MKPLARYQEEQRVFSMDSAPYRRQPELPAPGSNQERRLSEDDIITQFSELVDGSMRTDFELHFDGHELYGRDGKGLGEVTQKSLENAEVIVADNPNLGFEHRRRVLEREEYELLISMAAGRGPNTMIVISDFPEELRDADQDVGGYNTTRQQAMARVYVRVPGEGLVMYSQSLDGSNRKALESIYEYFNSTAQPDELLGQRIHAEVDQADQSTIIDLIMGLYDRSMSEQFTGRWHAGRRPVDLRNTYDFVRGQRQIIDACMQLEARNELTKSVMYNMAATMQKRFSENKQEVESPTGPRKEQSTDLSHGSTYVVNPALEREMVLAGNEARSQGKTFSACGGTLSGGEEATSTLDKLNEAGFGNKTKGSEDWTGGKTHYNKKCASCEQVKDKVGACHICKECVDDPGKRAKRYKAFVAAKHSRKQPVNIANVQSAKARSEQPNQRVETPETKQKRVAAAAKVRLKQIVQYRPWETKQ